MRAKSFDGMVCPIAGALAVIGDRWGALVLRDLTVGLSRYDEFRRSSGITNAMLSDRLKHLESSGLVGRRPYQTNPERLEYFLTEKGWEIVPLMVTLADLGERWGASGADGPPLKFVNRRTDAVAKSAIVDQATGVELRPRDLTAQPGPGADDLVRWRLTRRRARQDCIE